VSKNAKAAAVAALNEKLGEIPRNGTIIIVDYTQPSQTKRLAVMNIQSGKILFHARVAHGVKSGGIYAEKLSNIIGSQQSSSGLFEVAEVFNGKHGPSLRLKGLNKDLNGNALKRGIIIHSAEYVSIRSILANWKDKFRLGRSDGCFALSNTAFRKLVKNLVRPAYLFVHSDDEDRKADRIIVEKSKRKLTLFRKL
jgi:hypothetical protein